MENTRSALDLTKIRCFLKRENSVRNNVQVHCLSSQSRSAKNWREFVSATKRIHSLQRTSTIRLHATDDFSGPFNINTHSNRVKMF